MKKIIFLFFIGQLSYCQSSIDRKEQGDKDYPTFYHLIREAQDLAAKEMTAQAIAKDALAPYYYQMPAPDLFNLSPEQRAEINKRRHEIGLKPLEELNAIMGEDGTMTITL